MACKVSLGMVGRIFGADNGSDDDSQPPVQSLCLDLADRLGSPGTRAAAPAEQVRPCLQAAIRVFEAPERSPEEKSDLLASLVASDVLARMVAVLPDLDFEARKDVMRLFTVILQMGTQPVFEYVRSHGQLLQLLLDGCGNTEVSLHSHMILRSCIRHVELVVALLDADFAAGLLKLTQHAAFDVSSDAFASLRELLLTHKAAAAAHLEAHFTEFFMPYNELVQAEDYVTKRQALRLLGEILLDRRYVRIMLRYVSDEHYLKIHMTLLRDNSKAIQADAFHVFKIFAANPNKPPRVHQILFKNRERLVKLLDAIGRSGDESFAQDRKAVVQALHTLQPLPARPPSGNLVVESEQPVESAAGYTATPGKEARDDATFQESCTSEPDCLEEGADSAIEFAQPVRTVSAPAIGSPCKG